ncbi:MAG: sigma-54-dependent transcriptional regulator [Gemmatimonadales bacterium]
MIPPGTRVLIADDDSHVLEALRLLLKGAGYQVETATSPGGILAAIEARDFDVVVLDMNYTRDTTGGAEGLDLLSRVQLLDATLPLLVMTAWGSIDGAVEAMRRGARDYIEKPWDNARLLQVLRTQVALGAALRRGQRLESENLILRRHGAPELVATAPSMQPVLRLLERVGTTEANALITGEHGTGKEILARWLYASSPRATRPLVTVSLAGLSEAAFEGELFGYAKGATSEAHTERVGRLEVADGGTVLLEEISDLSLPQQVKLLRVLQSGSVERIGSVKARQVSLRIICTTAADLAAEVAAGRFRQDLLFRLNTIEIRLPPLRERQEDIPILAIRFLKEYAERYRKPVARFHADAMRALLASPWPGNVRELAHVIERAVLLAEGDVVRAADLNLRPAGDTGTRLEDLSLEEVERLLIQRALARSNGNVSAAATALGLSRSALYRRLQSHGL